MRLLRGVRPNLDEASAYEVEGLAGWVLGLVRGWRGQRVSQEKKLQLVETLPLGGRRQLMLVTCAGESFLVGGSFESVDTIVRLKAEATLDFAADRWDESCR
ncbi:flagellar biosynthetic protein FliO [Tunturiibacter gelidoferens]|uniref:Flagellar biogenesis protein FliO n=3 Tax=Tunturiibacter TaxID=3154218 RepID=A0A7Y9NMQ0_9BACT|nr:flagellar biosynthetic protein FliO [Edaphobacter lichenicola]NYF52204.1 flagellar biogenesis protein FliO [Edaphobacter lichenicola]